MNRKIPEVVAAHRRYAVEHENTARKLKAEARRARLNGLPAIMQALARAGEAHERIAEAHAVYADKLLKGAATGTSERTIN